MAFVDDTLLEDEQESGGPSSGASAVAGGGNAPASAGAPAASPKQKTPGNFANLSEYLRVNQPLNFGQQVAGKVGGEIDAGNEAVDDAEKQFKERVEGNTIRDTQGLTQKLSQDPASIDKDAFAQIRDASYKGPRSLADTQDLSSRVLGAAGTATGKAAASGTESGRFALLDSYFKKPEYSQGQKTLDNLLIQNDPNSQQAFSEIRNRAGQLSDKTKNLDPALAQFGAQGNQTTLDTRAGARAGIGIDDTGNLTGGGAIGNARGGIDSRYGSESKRIADELAMAQGVAGKNKYGLSPEFLEAMGVQGLTRGYGVDAMKYLSPNSITKENAVSSDDAARLRALESLGGADSYLNENGEFGTSDATKGYSFNKDAYGKQVEGQKNIYTRDKKAAIAELAAAQSQFERDWGGFGKSIEEMKQQRGSEQTDDLNWPLFDAQEKAIRDAKAKIANLDAKYLGTPKDRNFDPGKMRT